MTDQEKDQLKQALLSDITRLANTLLPGGKVSRGKWRCDNQYGGEGQSFNMELSGDKAGVWHDFASGDSGDVFHLIMQNQQLDFQSALEWAQQFTSYQSSINKSQIDSSPKTEHKGYDNPPKDAYVYCDNDDEPVLWVQRVEDGDKKRFIQWSKSGDKYYKTSAYCPKPYPLFYVPLKGEDDDPIVIHEGEKCADFASDNRLEGWHTCTAGGASAARMSDYSPLAGRSVYICPDNDEAGQKYASDVVDCLKDAGVQEIRIINLEPLPHKGDVVDWFEQGKTAEDWSLAVANASVVYTRTVVETPISDGRDFRYVPEELLSMPGFVNDVVDYTMSVSPYPNRVHAFGAAVCLQGLLASNRIVGDMGTRPNVYINCLGASASGKNKPRSVNRQILNEIGAHTHVYDNIASMEGLEDLLEQHSNVLFQPDEFDSFLAASASGDSRFRRISTFLMTLFTSSDADLTRRPKANEKGGISQVGRIIERPHLSMLATSTPTRYFESLDSSSMSDGFIGRMVTLCAKPTPRQMSDPNKDYEKPIPESILEVAKHWWALNKPECEQEGGMFKYHFPKPVKVGLTKDAYASRLEAEQYFVDRFNANIEDESKSSVYGRGLEHVNKWSLLMACSANPYNLVVQAEHIEAAFRFVRYQIKTVLNASDHYVYKSEDEKKVKRVKQVLQEHGGSCNKGDIMRKAGYSKKSMNDILSSMEEMGMIEIELLETGKRGPKPTIVSLVA